MMLDTTWQDLRYGWRSLVLIRSEYPPGNNNRSLQYPWFEKLAQLTQFFAGASAVAEWDRSNVSVNGEADQGQVRVGLVSGNYFSLLGVTARIGRTLTLDDDRILEGHPVAVISDSYWERRFGRAADIAGRTLSLRGTTYTILGVTPRGFSGEWVGKPIDVWIPIAMVAQVLSEIDPGPARGGRVDYHAIARLTPGVRVPEAEAVSTAMFQDILSDQAGAGVSASQLQSFRRARITLEPAATGCSPQRTSFAQPLAILMAIVGFVLTIACANVTNLLLARSAARRREIAVRLAIGASRGRIGRQFLTESALLAALGGAVGLFFSQWATDVLAALVRSGPAGFNIDPVTLTLNLRPDGRVLTFTATLCLVTALLFGITPAFRSTRISLSSMLGGRGVLLSGFASRFSLSRLLVVAQVALSLGLVIGAGLFLRTLHNLQGQGVGVDREHVLLVWTSTLQSGRRVGTPVAQLFETAQQRVALVPGVASASASVYGLLNGSSFPGGDVRVQGAALAGGDATSIPRCRS